MPGFDFSPGLPTSLLACVQYDNGGVAHSYTSSSNATADVDASNLAVTFACNERVLVRLTALVSMTSSADYGAFTVREGASDIGPRQVVMSPVTAAENTQLQVTAVFLITGITPGIHTYKWGYAVGAGNFVLYVGALGSSNAWATMEVWAN